MTIRWIDEVAECPEWDKLKEILMPETIVAEKPKRVRKPKAQPDATVTPIPSTPVGTMTNVSLIFHEAKDGSRTGIILIGPDPFQWLADNQRKPVNYQKWLPTQAVFPRVAPTEVQCWGTERGRNGQWARGTYVGRFETILESDAQAALIRMTQAADAGHIYIVGTLEVQS